MFGFAVANWVILRISLYRHVQTLSWKPIYFFERMFKQQSIVCKAISCYKEADSQYRYLYIKNKHLNYKSLGNLVKVDFMFAGQFVIGSFYKTWKKCYHLQNDLCRFVFGIDLIKWTLHKLCAVYFLYIYISFVALGISLHSKNISNDQSNSLIIFEVGRK